MTLYTHNKKEILERIERISITDYVRKGILELERKGYRFNLGHPLEVERFKELLNDSKNTSFKSLRGINGFYYWDEQEVDSVCSNLGYGKGHVFYFRCNGCGQRVKYLYEYNSCYSPICRKCCRLGYKYPTKKSESFSHEIFIEAIKPTIESANA